MIQNRLIDCYYFWWYSAALVALDTAGEEKIPTFHRENISKKPKNNYAENILDSSLVL